MTLESKIYSVSEITSIIKSVLETNLPPVWVEGELSGYTMAASGHIYFTLKDAGSQIPCVLWKSQAATLLFKPENGMTVRVAGRLTVYERGGRYQLAASQLMPVGIGDLFVKFERLKRKLAGEGLFDDDRKRALPEYPEAVGIVTSRDGAALWDIERVLLRRAPNVRRVLASVRVQGEGAAEEIAAGIGALNERDDIDVIIVGRGGGSIEDLWQFNTELVARAVAESRVPVISAVGHETDFTLADFAADVRASTPSVAAELAVPDRNELEKIVAYWEERLEKGIMKVIHEAGRTVDEYEGMYGVKRIVERLSHAQGKLEELTHMLLRLRSRIVKYFGLRLDSLSDRLSDLNPESVLARGYSVVYKKPDRAVITRAVQVETGDMIDVRLHVGSFSGTITEIQDG